METDATTDLMAAQVAGVKPGPSSLDPGRAARMVAMGLGAPAGSGGSGGSPPPAASDPEADLAREARAGAMATGRAREGERVPLEEPKSKYAVDQDDATKARLRAMGVTDGEMIQQKRVGENTWNGKIEAGQRYEQAHGVVGHVLGALDYVSNIWRSAQEGGMDAATMMHRDSADGPMEKGGLGYQARMAWQYAKQAALKERQVTPGDLKDTYTQAFLDKNVRFGKDDGKFQWGDVADIGLDLGVGVLTDPLMALTEGVSALRSGSGFLAKGAAEARVGLQTPAAARYARTMAIGRGAVGGVLGAGTADPDQPGMMGEKTPWYDVAARVAAGAALGVAAPSMVKVAAGAGREALDAGADIYAGVTRGEEFIGAGSARRVANAGRAKQQSIARWIVQGRLGAMKDLVGPERDAFTETMHDLKNASVEYRETKLAGGQWKEGMEGWDRAFNKYTAEANDYVADQVMPQLLKKKYGDNPELYQKMVVAVNDMADHNTNVAARINSEKILSKLPGMSEKSVAGRAQGAELEARAARNAAVEDGRVRDWEGRKMRAEAAGEDFDEVRPMARKFEEGHPNWDQATTVGKSMEDVLTGKSALGMPGLRFHIDDVYQFQRQGEAGSILKKLTDQEAKIQAARSGRTAKAGADAGLTADETYAVYAQRFSKHFLDQEELKAMELSGRYGQTPAKQSAVRAWENYALRPFDATTNFMKAGMLYFSTSWVRTQLFDNLSKAFTEGGFGNLAKTAWDATGGAWSTMGKDLRALLRGDTAYRLSHPDLIEAMSQGVIHDGLFGALRSELVGDFLHRPDQLVDAGGALSRGVEAAGAKYKASTQWLMNDASGVSHVVKLMQGVGSYMEGAARMSTYTGARDALIAAGVERATAMSSAAKLVERTFFNYSDVTAMEAAVAKRLMPFYTFYSKNLPYWLQAFFDPARVGRVAALDQVRKVMGTTPTKFDVKGMTPYIADNAPRKLGKDDKGNKRYVVSPVDPRVEALKMVDPHHVMDTLQERGNSLIKVPLELLTGHDFFTDDKLYPSDQPKGRKYLFSRGFKWVAANEVAKKLEKFVGAEVGNPLGVDVDKRGNPFATSDNLVRADKLLQALFPQGAIEQVAAPIGKNMHGKETAGVSAMNRLSPYQTVAVSPPAERMERSRKDKERARESHGHDGK